MALSTVLTSTPSRRAISFLGSPSTGNMWRISAHYDILITSRVLLARVDRNGFVPIASISPQENPHIKILGVPFQDAVSSNGRGKSNCRQPTKAAAFIFDANGLREFLLNNAHCSSKIPHTIGYTIVSRSG